MLNFKILSFYPSINPNTGNRYSFKPNDKFIYNTSAIDGEYLYHGFGLYRGDADTVASHVMGLYLKLSRREPESEQLINQLIDDLSNYLVCLRNGYGDKDTVYSIMNICAMAGCEKQLYDLICNHYKKCIDPSYDIKRRYCQLDFTDFYIRVADKLLIDAKTKTSILFYELAGLTWDDDAKNIKRNGPVANKDSEKWDTKYNVFSQIMDGAYNLDLKAFDCEQKERLLTLYKNCIDKLKVYDAESINLTNKLIEMVGFSFGLLSDNERLGLFMIASLKKHYASNIAFLISEQSDQIKDEYYNKLFDLFRGETSVECEPIHDWIQMKKPTQEEFEKLLAFVRTLYYTEIVMELLRTNSETVQAAYYTSYDTFAFMFPDNCTSMGDNECGRLSVMNISYMNDPNEGSIVRRQIYGKKIFASRYKERRKFDSPCVFIKCFTSMVDYLPMWKMYGGNAEGVCIVFNWAGETNHSLYHVCYINKNSRGYSIRKEDNKSINSSAVNEAITQIKKLYSKIQSVEDRETFDRILDPVSYLFKDASYSYEQEMRIMYRLDYGSPIIRKTKHSPPMLYVLHDTFLEIDEIILGPKFVNVASAIPYMKQQIRIICDKNGVKTPAITRSNIDFQ